jgi:hypothetical protein
LRDRTRTVDARIARKLAKVDAPRPENIAGRVSRLDKDLKRLQQVIELLQYMKLNASMMPPGDLDVAAPVGGTLAGSGGLLSGAGRVGGCHAAAADRDGHLLVHGYRRFDAPREPVQLPRLSRPSGVRGGATSKATFTEAREHDSHRLARMIAILVAGWSPIGLLDATSTPRGW